MKICLDAGHGTGQNQSPARCGYFEGDRMFTLQRLLQQELEAYGVTVVCTRAARQDDPPLYTRALAAKDCDLFLSLHSNAAGNGVCESVDYPVVFYPVSGKGIGLAAELAECIHKTMGTLQPAQTRVRWNSAHNADYYGVIRFTAAFGVDGVLLALAVFGLRCMVTLPCYFLLAAASWGTSAGLAAVSFGRGRRTAPVVYGRACWVRFGACCLALLAGVCAELFLSPVLLRLMLERILG